MQVPSSLNAQKQHLFCKILVLFDELDIGTSTSDEYAVAYAFCSCIARVINLRTCAGNQLRNVYRKLESDLQGSRKRMAELV
ncbi:hypothetical protein AgCh_028504 [Apium graveolens]